MQRSFLHLSLGLGITLTLGVGVIGFSAEAQAMELLVPYVSQVLNGAWVAPWDEACEEASIVMLNGFYQKRTAISNAAAKTEMQSMIDWENMTFKKNADTDAEQTAQLIQQFGSFETTIKRTPSLDEIKAELDKQYPVIALVNMYQFYNERSAGDSYHVFLIVGYDDRAGEFIVNDPGRLQRRYTYDRVLHALHDYNPMSKEADKEATVLFTRPKPSFMGRLLSTIASFFRQLLV